MTKEFTQRALRHPRRQSWSVMAGLVCLSFTVGVPASAQERILFTAVDNAQAELITLIRNERVRIDVSMWLLTDRSVTYWIVQRHLDGLPVRVIGDRAGIFEADVTTRREFEYLASHGVPIRLRYHPTWFPEIIHWKTGIFVGQNIVEFGSANWTSYELRPFSSTDFKDETAFFTNDQALVNAFKTKFDQYWNDTQYFLDWPTVYRNETGATWPTPMTIPRGRLEPDYATNVPGMIWGQGPELNTRLIQEINRETQRIDLVTYRMTVPEITNALIARHRAGVRVRVFAEPAQYRNAGYPEYWLVGAEIDRLLVAGVPVKQRTHMGLTHMKSLVTSTVALVASSNFTRFWERDHNYFVSALTKPAIHAAFLNRLDEMWNDTANYAPFQPQRPRAPVLVSPGNGRADVPTTARLEWKRAPFAVAFDVYMGRDPANLALVGRINAVVTEHPPEMYSFIPPQGLQPSIRYYWRIVSRTFATDLDPALRSASETFHFVTAATVAPPAPGPAQCVGSSPGPGWSCVNGAWLPPAGGVPPPTGEVPPPAPTPPTSCPGAPPVQGWVCVNGGWLPPDHPLALSGAPAPAPAPAPVPTPSTCSTVKPATNWVCVNGGWVPPDSPLAAGAPAPAPSPPPPPAPAPGTCSTPDPFGALGGGVCVGGAWVPKGHPLAGSGGP